MKQSIVYPVIVREGVFCREDRYRFHCWVNIDGEEHLCYLPSNCKFEKMCSLKGRTVLLSDSFSKKSKFDYKVEAVKYRNSQMLLNLSFLNRVMEQELRRKKFSFLGERKNIVREKVIYGYKSDLYIEETNTIIEIKSVFAFSVSANYPANYSSHMLEQLEKLKDIADGKAKVVYFIVGLGPTVKKIRIDLKSKYGELMDECRCAGVQFVAMNLQNKKGYYCVNDFIYINFYESEK